MQDKRPYNEKEQRHGKWVVHHNLEGQTDYGKLFYIENFINGVQVGYEENHWTFATTERKYYAR